MKISRPSWLRRRSAPNPNEDYGFFGPDSVTWKVWGYPTSMSIGFQRAVVIEELDPFLIAAVDATQRIYDQPRIRYEHTLKYFATTAFGDSATAVAASETLMKIHARAVGTEPVTGGTYDANDPAQQLWIHLTAWHSLLYAYERFGAGRLTAAEESRYWEECAVAAELQTCDSADVPRTRDGIRAYFEQMRPKLVASEAAQAAMNHLLSAEVMFPPMPVGLFPAAAVVNATLRAATISTMPQWQRELAHLRQPRYVDTALVPVLKTVFWIISRSGRAESRLLTWISPATQPVVEHYFRRRKPRKPVVRTPSWAFDRYGAATPRSDAGKPACRRRVSGRGGAVAAVGAAASRALA